jgi:hypothetical protein
MDLYHTFLAKLANIISVNFSITNASIQLPAEVIIEIRRILAGLILFMLVFDLVFTFVLIGFIYLHRRHIRNIAAKEGLTLTFKVRGPQMYKIYCVFFLIYGIIAIVGTVLTLAGILPLQLTPAAEETLTSIVLIFMLVLIVGFWPTAMVIGSIIDIRDQRGALRVARGAK